MTEPKHAANDSVRDFVVVTRVKPDGRKIHYYEWPARPAEAAKAERTRAATTDRRRV